MGFRTSRAIAVAVMLHRLSSIPYLCERAPMKWSRLSLTGSVLLATVSLTSLGVQTLSAVAAHALVCNTWYGPGGSATGATSGAWSAPTNWSSGVTPLPTDNVCITAPGTYTVTLAPWSVGTADPQHNGSVINSLTLGAASGEQTLVVSGVGSVSNSNETVNNVFLSPTGPSTINASGTLILDSTNMGAPPTGGDHGGSAWITGGPLTNHGHIVAQVEDTFPEKGTLMAMQSFTNAPGATLQVNSGQLMQESGTTLNEGTITIARGAVMLMQPSSFGGSAVLTNASSVMNNGSIGVNNSTTWTQKAGSIKGNPVTLGSGSTLIDHGGSAEFLADILSSTLEGTIPKGQTVTVVGTGPFNVSGNQSYNTAVSLNGTKVVNDGTLVLETTGKGTKTGGSVTLDNGSLVNNGTVVARIMDKSWGVHFQVALTNQRAGNMSVSGGELYQDSGTPTINNGRVTISSDSTYLVQGGSFTNTRGATTSIQLGGVKRLGQFVLNAGSVFTAGGTLALPFSPGYRAAARSVFPIVALGGGKFAGTFQAMSHGFTLDLKGESASPAFTGVSFRS